MTHMRKKFEPLQWGGDKGKDKKGEVNEIWDIRSNLHQMKPKYVLLDDLIRDPVSYYDIKPVAAIVVRPGVGGFVTSTESVGGTVSERGMIIGRTRR